MIDNILSAPLLELYKSIKRSYLLLLFSFYSSIKEYTLCMNRMAKGRKREKGWKKKIIFGSPTKFRVSS